MGLPLAPYALSLGANKPWGYVGVGVIVVLDVGYNTFTRLVIFFGFVVSFGRPIFHF